MTQQDVSVAGEAQWQILPDARLRLRYWDEECVVFHGAAGNTHRLPELVGRMLEALQAGSATIEQLSERIDLDSGDVAQALRDMQRLGIAQCLR